MDFWIFLLVIIALIFGYPFIRSFVKRLVCFFKIKKICKKKKYVLHKTHTLWFLGRKNGKNCDCYIETPTQIFSIKFYGVIRRRKTLIVLEGGTYYFRRFLWLASRYGIRAVILFLSTDGKPKKMQEYNFNYKFKEEWKNKNIRKIFFVNPVPLEIRYKPGHSVEDAIRSGDDINGMELWTMSGMVHTLSDAL